MLMNSNQQAFIVDLKIILILTTINWPYFPWGLPIVQDFKYVSYRIRSAMKFLQNVLHNILHLFRVYVIQIEYLSRYSQRTQD